jgi:hypothetical protein
MKKEYQSPVLDIVDICVECGFATSNLENPVDGGENSWE